jgi:hypothetical protein
MKRFLLLFLLFLSVGASAQHKQTNWLQEKKEYTGRWRVGCGLDVSEPTGIDVQFYRLSKICTNDFSIIKKLAIGTWVGKEGVVFGSLIDKSNNDTWKSGGIRYGIDLKFYIPIFLNPYLGFGAEGGTRNLNNKLEFYPDVIARVGIEQKVLGVKLSSTSSLNITIFADGKINRCITEDFTYILPSFGVRFHFL